MGCVAAPLPAPMQRPVAMPPVPVVAETAQSAAKREYYAQVQASLLSQGLLRTDGGGVDTPFTDRILADTFLKIALYNEYTRTGGAAVQLQSEATLRRWQAPVRVGLRFGASVPADRRASDTARVASYLQRLSGLTGLPIRLDESAPNFWVYFVNEDERQALGPALRAAMPQLNGNEVSDIINLPQSTYCVALTQSQGNSSVYNRAFIVIRAEHPDLLRLSCIHEELAQALGLPNDSPQARPSIFNDDEEFALLTRQDEMMLRILYNPALRPGMRIPEARPIVEQLATALRGGAS
ncbi:MAG: DUF2927 domain-containing protein [Cypionkella sp.]